MESKKDTTVNTLKLTSPGITKTIFVSGPANDRSECAVFGNDFQDNPYCEAITGCGLMTVR